MRTITLFLIITCATLSLFSQSFIQGPSLNQSLRYAQFADFNADGLPDILGSEYVNSQHGRIVILINTSDSDTISFERVDLGVNITWDLANGDFDGDGDIDIIAHDYDENKVLFLYNKGDGTFESQYPDFDVYTSFRTGNLNGDNYIDIVAVYPNENRFTLLLNDGSGNFQPSSLNYDFEDLLQTAVADINNDGIDDILAAFEYSLRGTVVVFENQGDASFQDYIIYEDGKIIYQITLKDLNLDGATDVLLSGVSETLFGLINKGDQTYEEIELITSLGIILSFDVADYNTDGIPDIMLGHNSTDQTLHLGLSNESFEYDTEVISGIQPLSNIISADLDGDNDLDVVATNGSFWWLKNELEQSFMSSTNDQTFEANIFPNPFSDYINIQSKKVDGLITISTVNGMPVHTSKTTLEALDLDFLENGYYILTITDPNTGKIVHSNGIVKVD